MLDLYSFVRGLCASVELPPQWFFVYFLFVVHALGVHAISECEIRFFIPVEA